MHGQAMPCLHHCSVHAPSTLPTAAYQACPGQAAPHLLWTIAALHMCMAWLVLVKTSFSGSADCGQSSIQARALPI